jgi:uncharacterized protein
LTRPYSGNCPAGGECPPGSGYGDAGSGTSFPASIGRNSCDTCLLKNPYPAILPGQYLKVHSQNIDKERQGTMNALIRSRKKQIEEFCRAWNIKELQVFGSVTTDHFRPDSDIDIVVDFPPGSPHTLIQLAKMEAELEGIFGRRIDLLTRQAVEKSRNYIRKKSILSSMEKVYGA